MRLLRFYVRQHLLLRDLDLRFDRPGRLDTGQYTLDFLVGVNGTGKSTLLRALTQTFVNLRNNWPNRFDFILEYTLGDKNALKFISIQYETRDGRSVLKMTVKAGEEVLYESELIDVRYLPRRVIVYSTGSESEWDRLAGSTSSEPGAEDASAELLKDSIQRAIKELPGSMVEHPNLRTDGDEPSPFWLIHAERLPAMTLCGLLAHLATESRPLKDVIEAIGIRSIPGFSLRFRLHTTLSDKDHYRKLAKHATRCLRQGTDYLLYFDLSNRPELANELLKDFGSSFELFRILDRLSNDDPSTGQPTLQQVSLFLQRKPAPVVDDEQPKNDLIPGLFLLDWLSDGEQSFLGRMAMLAMLDTDDSLIILDEPEVHFNDYWKRKIVQLLDTIMRGHTNQLIMTTHSTIVMSDVTAAQVTLFTKNEQGIAEVAETVSPVFGSDPSDIMINLLGTGRAGGAYSREILESAIKKGDPDELRDLLKKVGPGYWQFRILDRLEGLNAPSD